MGESDKAIEAMRQKLNNQLLRKRMEQAARAQANLQEALEMSRSVDVHDLELSAGALEVDDADLFDVDIQGALDDIDDMTESLDQMQKSAEQALQAMEDELDDLDALSDADLDDVDDVTDLDDDDDDVTDLEDEDFDEMTTDDLQLLESKDGGLGDDLGGGLGDDLGDLAGDLGALDDALEASRVKLSADEEAEILAAMRSNEPPRIGELGGGSSAASGTVDDALAALAGGLRESLARNGGQPELQAAAQLLEGLAGRLGQPTPADANREQLLAAYLDLARVLAASGAALALVVEKHLADGAS